MAWDSAQRLATMFPLLRASDLLGSVKPCQNVAVQTERSELQGASPDVSRSSSFLKEHRAESGEGRFCHKEESNLANVLKNSGDPLIRKVKDVLCEFCAKISHLLTNIDKPEPDFGTS